MIDEKALLAAQRVTTTAGQTGHLKSAPVPLHVLRAALEAYESAKPKEAEGLKLGQRVTVDGVEAVVVPESASSAQLDRAVAFALNVSLGGDYRWTDYMRDLYGRFLSAAGERA